MNLVVEFFREMALLIGELAEVAAGEIIRAARITIRRLQAALRVAIAWPFVLMLVAITNYGFAQWAVPIVTILALLPLLWIMTAQWSIGVLAAEALIPRSTPLLGRFVAEARRISRIIRFIVGLELLVGIYLSIFPVANDRRLALLLILVAAAIVCFVGISKKVVWVLVGIGCVITLIFCLGGRDNLKKVFAERNFERRSADHSQIPTIPKPQPLQEGSPAPYPPPDKLLPGAVTPSATPPRTAIMAPEVVLPKPCESKKGNGSTRFQYGDFVIQIDECHRDGSQMRFSGTVNYTGKEEKFLVFHRFFVSNANSGVDYPVQSGQIGESPTFGRGYCWVRLGPGRPTVSFSFVVGSIEESSEEILLNIRMPYNQSEEGVSFDGLGEKTALSDGNEKPAHQKGETHQPPSVAKAAEGVTFNNCLIYICAYQSHTKIKTPRGVFIKIFLIFSTSKS